MNIKFPNHILNFHNKIKLVILPINPEKIFCYWELNDKEFSEIRNRSDNKKAVIRIFDITGLDNTELDKACENFNSFCDVLINTDSDNWYIDYKDSFGKYLYAEIGFYDKEKKNEKKEFTALAGSNTINMPFDNDSSNKQAWLLKNSKLREIFSMLFGASENIL